MTHGERYTINIEYCGAYHKKPVEGLDQGQAYVVRFCGEFIGKSLDRDAAECFADRHSRS